MIGLQNALERGESLRTAMQSFIDSGYLKEEVEEASKMLNKGALQDLDVPEEAIHYKTKFPKKNPEKETEKKDKGLESERKKWTIIAIILAIVFFILVGVLILTIFFREKIFSFLFSLFD